MVSKGNQPKFPSHPQFPISRIIPYPFILTLHTFFEQFNAGINKSKFFSPPQHKTFSVFKVFNIKVESDVINFLLIWWHICYIICFTLSYDLKVHATLNGKKKQ